jgi:hypothetical protein
MVRHLVGYIQWGCSKYKDTLKKEHIDIMYSLGGFRLFGRRFVGYKEAIQNKIITNIFFHFQGSLKVFHLWLYCNS